VAMQMALAMGGAMFVPARLRSRLCCDPRTVAIPGLLQSPDCCNPRTDAIGALAVRLNAGR
jgi:hypothetical protein